MKRTRHNRTYQSLDNKGNKTNNNGGGGEGNPLARDSEGAGGKTAKQAVAGGSTMPWHCTATFQNTKGIYNNAL